MSWFVYRGKEDGKELFRHDVKNMFASELIATVELLAYENNIDKKDIKWGVEE
jgi:hypothetical protein